MKTLTLQLPDEIYEALQHISARSAKRFEDVAVEYLARNVPKTPISLTDEQRRAARQRLRRHAGAIDSGDHDAADNERIDSELAREYGNAHESGT